MNNITTMMKYVRSFRKRAEIPLKDAEIFELFGICLGDGHLSRYFSKYDDSFRYTVGFTGNFKDDFEYYESFLMPLLKSKFKIRLSIKRREYCGAININISNRTVFDFFKDIGMPVGKKKDAISIPDSVFKESPEIKAAILRGLLDTDGCIYARKDERYRYPHIKITSINSKFLLQLRTLIREFDLPAYVHLEGRSISAGDVVVRGSKNIISWMDKIGTSHPIVKQRYREWLSTGILLPKSLHYNKGS